MDSGPPRGEIPEEPWFFWERLLEKYDRVYNPKANAEALEKMAEQKRRMAAFNARFNLQNKQ